VKIVNLTEVNSVKISLGLSSLSLSSSSQYFARYGVEN
jgi:hypothetical protein